jgi:hypothetical protein
MAQAGTDVGDERLDLSCSLVRDSQHQLGGMCVLGIRPTAASSMRRLVMASSRVLG